MGYLDILRTVERQHKPQLSVKPVPSTTETGHATSPTVASNHDSPPGALLSSGCCRHSTTLHGLAHNWCGDCLCPSARIWWEAGGKEKGPAIISGTVLNSGGLWCWAEGLGFQGWVLASVITRLEPGLGGA